MISPPANTGASLRRLPGVHPKNPRETSRTRVVYLSIKTQPVPLAFKGPNPGNEPADFGLKDDRLLFIDTYSPMLNPDGQPRAELFQKDNLHMNAEGTNSGPPHQTLSQMTTNGCPLICSGANRSCVGTLLPVESYTCKTPSLTPASGVVEITEAHRRHTQDLARATGEHFNVFQILGVGHLEVKTHSPILENY